MADGVVVIVLALQIHKLGDGSLDGGIATADHACLDELMACIVARHLDGTLHTLTDVDDNLPLGSALFEGIDEPRILRGIAAAKGSHHDATQIRRSDDVADEVFPHTWEE